MFQPEHFKETDIEKVCALVRENPLGTLVLHHEEGFEVNHIPFVLDVSDQGVFNLRAHIPKANPLARLVESAKSSVVVFSGAEGYISPSWYATKKKHGKVVPTWNYSVVHLHGRMQLITDPQWVESQLIDLTHQNEKNRDAQWKVSDAPREYTEKMISVLLGIEIRVSKVEAKTKASQNQPDENRESVLASLRAEQPDSSLTGMMESLSEMKNTP